MPGLDPGIHAFLSICQDVDGRDKPGHDDAERAQPSKVANKGGSAPPAQQYQPDLIAL